MAAGFDDEASYDFCNIPRTHAKTFRGEGRKGVHSDEEREQKNKNRCAKTISVSQTPTRDPIRVLPAECTDCWKHEGPERRLFIVKPSREGIKVEHLPLGI